MSAVFIPRAFLETKHVSDDRIRDLLTFTRRTREEGAPKYVNAILENLCAYLRNRMSFPKILKI